MITALELYLLFLLVASHLWFYYETDKTSTCFIRWREDKPKTNKKSKVGFKF